MKEIKDNLMRVIKSPILYIFLICMFLIIIHEPVIGQGLDPIARQCVGA